MQTFREYKLNNKLRILELILLLELLPNFGIS